MNHFGIYKTKGNKRLKYKTFTFSCEDFDIESGTVIKTSLQIKTFEDVLSIKKQGKIYTREDK